MEKTSRNGLKIFSGGIIFRLRSESPRVIPLCMEALLTYRGKRITAEDVVFIRQLIDKNPGIHAGFYRRNCARPGVGGSPTGFYGTWSAGG